MSGLIAFIKSITFALVVFFVTAAATRPFLGDSGVWVFVTLFVVWLAGRAYHRDSPSWFPVG